MKICTDVFEEERITFITKRLQESTLIFYKDVLTSMTTQDPHQKIYWMILGSRSITSKREPTMKKKDNSRQEF